MAEELVDGDWMAEPLPGGDWVFAKAMPGGDWVVVTAWARGGGGGVVFTKAWAGSGAGVLAGETGGDPSGSCVSMTGDSGVGLSRGLATGSADSSMALAELSLSEADLSASAASASPPPRSCRASRSPREVSDRSEVMDCRESRPSCFFFFRRLRGFF